MMANSILKGSIFRKIFILFISISFLFGGIILTVTVREQTQQIENSLIRENKLISQAVSQVIESGYRADQWPFKTIKLFSDSENIVFLWIVKPDGEIYYADDPELFGKVIEDPSLGTESIVVKDSFYPKTGENIKIIVQPLRLELGKKPWGLYMGVSMASVKAAEQGIIFNSILFFSVIFLIVALISFYLAKGVTKPLERLKEGAESIGGGNLDYRIRIQTGDELEKLAESFNIMAESLYQSMKALEKERASLDVKVKERTKELMETQEQLIHSEKMATIGTLAGGVAHEVNNPLGTILINAQMLLRDIKDEGKKKHIKLIEESTRRCRDIVQTLLRYSRKPEMGEFESIDLNTVITDSCNLLQHQLEKDNIKIETEYGSIPYMRGNANELQQVFTNLILNAGDAVKEKRKTKDTEKPGKITIITSQKGKFIVSQIIDNGIGIPEENIKRIFDPFFTTKDVGGGTGLGLSITYKIIEKHSGEIDVSSKMDEGTTFTIKLPVSEK